MSSDRPSIREWTFPNSANSSPTLPHQPSPSPTPNTASRPVEVAHGRSSSTAPELSPSLSGGPRGPLGGGPGHANGGKRGLASINEDSGFKGKDLRHRTNASVFAAQMGGGGAREGVTFPTSPQQAVKMVYSNVRRRSLSDLAYSVLFVGSLLLFAYS